VVQKLIGQNLFLLLFIVIYRKIEMQTKNVTLKREPVEIKFGALNTWRLFRFVDRDSPRMKIGRYLSINLQDELISNAESSEMCIPLCGRLEYWDEGFEPKEKVNNEISR
jgi:hypothetical protein